GLKPYYILTDLAAIPRNWPGLVGRISEKMIMEAIPDFDDRMYYISGPPSMVRASEQVLKHMGIQSHLIKKDFFPGLV
ncbi:MAG TPA: oxidoreductase, partial [Ktedonobacteraceae bacterium]|nr:oxidoreductase [Ktedonobacteraceae bacterium]